MSTPKEIFLELIRPDGQPERQLRQYEALHMCLNDPCNTYLRGNRKRGTTSRDRWGTTILFPADAPGPMPDTREGACRMPGHHALARDGPCPRSRVRLRRGMGRLPLGGTRRLRVGAAAGGLYGHGHL